MAASSTDGLLIAKATAQEPLLTLLPKYGNRHGLITGATGTGMTVTLQRLAEEFSAIGVPVFVADVKGDLAGMAYAGGGNPQGKRCSRVQRALLVRKSAPRLFVVFSRALTRRR